VVAVTTSILVSSAGGGTGAARRTTYSILAALVLGLFVQWAYAGDSTVQHPVRLGDEVIFSLSEESGGVPPLTRAKAAQETLEALVHGPSAALEVTVRGDTVSIVSGTSGIVELTEADRVSAKKPNLLAFGKDVASAIHNALERERRRAAIARRVVSLSSVVFLGIVALLLLQAVGRGLKRVSQWLDTEAELRGGVRVRTLELLSPSTTREGLRAFAQVILWSLRVSIVFGWTMMTLSLFDSTRGLAQRATGKLFLPALAFFERLAGEVPVLLATTAALVIVVIAIRFTLAYFAAIERGELESEWARPASAYVTGRVLAGGIALGSCLFVAPLVSGNADGILPRVGVLGLGTLALASTPLWASCALGLRLVYGGAIQLGDVVTYGGVSGEVVQIGLFDLSLVDDGSRVRVPHLMSLWHPTRVTRADRSSERRSRTSQAARARRSAENLEQP
jgi:hypothetical protein